MKNINAKPVLLAIAVFTTTTVSFAQSNNGGGDRHNRRSSNRERSVTYREKNNRPRQSVFNTPQQRNYSYQSRPERYNSRPVIRQNNYRRPVVVAYNRRPRYTIGVPYYGQQFHRINHPYVSIVFGGYNYHYYDGIFYRPYGSYFRVVVPPIGIHINILPPGYYRFNWRNNPYYYYNGVFYNQYNNYYEVVQPPLGAKLPTLPAGAKEQLINGQRYYEFDGTFYAEEYNVNNEVLYTVVGVHGVLDNALVQQLPNNENIVPAPSVNEPYVETPAPVNTVIQTLPANCKVVEENGQKYYLSPQNIYYQEIIAADGTVSYQVANISTSPGSY